MTIKQWQHIATEKEKKMTVEQLKQIINNLPNETQVYIETPDAWQDLSTVLVEYSDGGTVRLVLSTKEG